jgi:hypothetical protein
METSSIMEIIAPASAAAVLRAGRKRRLPPGFLVQKAVLAVKKQADARSREEKQQIDHLGLPVVHSQKQGHADQQQRPAAHAPAGQRARNQGGQKWKQPIYHSRYLTPPYSRNRPKIIFKIRTGTFSKVMPPITPPATPPAR